MGPSPQGKNRGGICGQNTAREVVDGERTMVEKVEGL